MQPTNCVSKSNKSPSAGSKRDCFQKSLSMYKESSSSTATTSSTGLGTQSSDEIDHTVNDEDEVVSTSPDLLTSSSACSSMQSSQSTSPLPPPSPSSTVSASILSSTTMTATSTNDSTNTNTTSTVASNSTKRRYRLAKKRTMPPRSNSTPCPPENENSSNTRTSTSSSSSSSSLLSSRVARFAYSESLQRRLIQGFLRQNSAEDVISSGKKKSSKENDTVSVTAVPTGSDITNSLSKSAKALSLSNIKSSSVSSIVKRTDKKDKRETVEDSGSRRNTYEGERREATTTKPRPKLSSLSTEPSMASIHSPSCSPPSSAPIPAIIVNECPDGGNISTNSQPTEDESKFTDDFK